MPAATAMSFNEVEQRALRASKQLGNWGKTMVVVKVDDPGQMAAGYTFFPATGDWRRTPRLQSAVRLGRLLH